jgi:tyrosine phenol-lyase
MGEGQAPISLPFEPYKTKVVEALPRPTRSTREAAIARAGYNLFKLTSDEVMIDLLTDSGTSAMSDKQWSALMLGDETYAGSRNFAQFESTVREITGFPFILPTHQGRAAENLLFSQLVRPGTRVPNNMHFDTTQAHVVRNGGKAVNLAIPQAYDPNAIHPFKGNMDVPRLRALLAEKHGRDVPVVLMTLTNNTGGGQPASLANLREVSAVCKAAGVPFYLDMCRWAENAYFIRQREAGWQGRSIGEIGRAIFDLAEGATMSAKKDGLVNIGGFVATRNKELADRMKQQLILFEGFPTYGGLARRDLAAMAVGLREAMEVEYLGHRIRQVEYLGRALDRYGVPYFHPPGGHAIYLDAFQFLPHLTPEELPGQALAVALYIQGGIRSVEVGRMMFGGEQEAGAPPPLELVRLAIPRRVYSASHLAYVAKIAGEVYAHRTEVAGMRVVERPEQLAHFSARFEPLAPMGSFGPVGVPERVPAHASAKGPLPTGS